MMNRDASCANCRHWGAGNPEAPKGRVAGAGPGARYCHRPRMIKEHLEARRPTDWCNNHQPRKDDA